MLSDLKRILDQISRDKGIDRQLLVDAIEEAVMSAAKKKFGQRRELEARYNDEIGEVELFQFRNVVPEVEDEQTEISLTEALILDPEVQLGDELGSKMDSVADLGRIAAQSAKQVIIQKMKDAECNVIYELYKERKGDVVNGIVQRFERGNIIVNLGRTDAILPTKEQMPRKSYRQGDRIRALLLDVRESSRDPQLVLSRTSDEFLTKLFAMEVPEIAEGIVKIMGVSREPGTRAKIAVSSSASDVDPVGACVGMKGSRVQNVVQELQGEKIDIVPWSPDPARYVSNALSPAQVSLVVVDEEKKTLVVVVPDDQLSLAIGRQGQNVRLAAALLGWRIDVKSEQKYAKFNEEGFQSLLDVPGMDEKTAEALYDAGFNSAENLGQAEVASVLAELESLDENRVARLIAAAQKIAKTQAQEDSEDPASTGDQEQ
ncbi:MAG: transcription termination/antitermination protein NusA [Deltaproteobacteria bacterium RIFOXYD12_FULL_56_24]|nr:MAG: transcription termination/antitermination protein NusA [Deltaproteobacteria bacterium RIFOXYD12_FULL_56_24]